MLTKFSGFFWRFVLSRKSSYFSAETDSVSVFSITWTALIKMVFPITLYIYHGGENFHKNCNFNYLCTLSGGLTSRLWVFWNLVQMDGFIWLKYFVGMFTSLFNSMTNRYCFGKSRFRLTKKTLSQTIISYIKESWRNWNSHSERFFSYVKKSRKFCPSCCRYVKNLWRSILHVLSWVAVSRKLL